jgi:hypothetical protein
MLIRAIGKRMTDNTTSALGIAYMIVSFIYGLQYNFRARFFIVNVI